MDNEESSPDYIVHHYSRRGHELPSTSMLLARGLHDLRSAYESDGWVNVSPSLNPAICEIGENLFEFVAPAPRVDWVGVDTVQDIPEWGTPCDEATEVFRLDDLEEFQSFNFVNVFAKSIYTPHTGPEIEQVISHLPNTQHRFARDPPDQGNSPHPAKLRRLDVGSLWRVIPQPHLYATLGLDGFLPTPAPHEFAFRGACLQALPPFTEGTCREVLQDRYARCSWIIPVRGVPPWHGCTPASIRAEEERIIAPLAANKSTSPGVLWTRDAMRDFWQFLIELRSAGRLGPIGLSYHAAPRSPHHHSLVKMAGTSARHLPTAAHSNEVQSSESKVTQQSIQTVDHFKLYHDAVQAGRIRNVLDAWAYKCKGQEGVVKKIRLLRGCILALVDETSQGILTC